jgi:UbiD family decarboxylase
MSTGSLRPALSMRAAVAAVRRDTPQQYHVRADPLDCTKIVADYAREYAGIPANSLARAEDVAMYSTVEDRAARVVLGLYGDPGRVRGWLPGYPNRVNPASVQTLLAGVREPVDGVRQADRHEVDLGRLPALRATDRDAGPYLTMGLVYARRSGDVGLSVHRMLLLDGHRLTLWMVPGRTLSALYTDALREGRRLPVCVNIGVPPAVMIASAVNSRFLPAGMSKLDLAGALAGEPIATAPADTQPTEVLAESEIVLEGYLDGTTADETLRGEPDGSLPEFLGYSGKAQRSLPVITVTGMSLRSDATCQAVIGPGREQSVILGLGGALSVALSEVDDGDGIHDLHFSPSGGGMLTLAVSMRKASVAADFSPARIARSVFDRHPFVKLIVFTDDDVDVHSIEDVMWAVSTRANLGSDCVTFDHYPSLPMDPSQTSSWLAQRGRPGRSFVDATVPYRVRNLAERSFPNPWGGRQ